LPVGVQKMLHLATAVPRRKQPPPEAKDWFLHRVGDDAVEFCNSVAEILGFIGEAVVACAQLMHGKARFRMRDFMLNIQECGAQALPVVTLISVLIGLILAFVGALQLKMFGAEIYVANLVAVGMAREMGAMMPGIIMAGRTGASFAAQLGTMQVNEEIDALKTMGFS
ncbi:TPA: hypothetical protein DDW35_12015, partial [Candidatus Sumerlaeota bacterium]|nr:hypothetical protein [Candidatus Sumerlaeota bacterium]